MVSSYRKLKSLHRKRHKKGHVVITVAHVDAELEVRVKKTNERTGCTHQEEYWLEQGMYCIIDDASPGIDDENTRIKVRRSRGRVISLSS